MAAERRGGIMSIMRQAAGEYLEMRRSLGYKLITQGRHVMSFADSMDAAGQETITTAASVDWATHPLRGTRPEYWCRRLEAVRLFARHMHALDPACEVPPPDILPFRAYRRTGGHRYTAEETAALITAAARLRPRLRALTWQTFLALLSVTENDRRDHALLAVGCQAGLRVSELTGLTVADIRLGTGPHVRCHGKGRKNRAVPLTAHTRQSVKAWLAERAGNDTDPVFPGRTGNRLSRNAVERLVAKHARTASAACPSMAGKHVTPHTMRHSAAMALVSAGTDISVIALWMGHESLDSSMAYIHADMALKQQALERTAMPGTKPGIYKPGDSLLAFLTGL